MNVGFFSPDFHGRKKFRRNISLIRKAFLRSAGKFPFLALRLQKHFRCATPANGRRFLLAQIKQTKNAETK
jgi:hypothetical protein